MTAAKPKHSILCVDDEADNVDALERLFRKKYRVLKATSGDEALELLKSNSFAVIISDQRMPGISGVELLTRSIEFNADTIRILLTGYTDIESIISAINSGHIYRYVTKPWDPVDLSNAVDKAVERYEIGHQLVEKNRDLEKALAELRTLDQAKSQFMILVNHELKTPLTAITSFGELLGETKLDDDQKLYLKRIRSSTERLQALVNDVLEFVSAETGLTKTDKKSVSTANLFGMKPDLADRVALERKVVFQIDIEPATVFCDERHLRNVYQRLMHNAAKFSTVGSTVLVKGSALGDGFYQLSIENEGPKIDQSKIELLLKPFTLNENIMNHSTGTGLGWSVCQGLLKLHASRLEVQTSGPKIKIGFKIPTQA